MARRAASSCRAVIQAHAWALRPKSPKTRVLPAWALPWRRPRWDLWYFTLLGWSICPSRCGHRRWRRFLFGDYVALVDPDLHPDTPQGGMGLGHGEVNVGPQGLERHPAFLGRFSPGDLP